MQHSVQIIGDNYEALSKLRKDTNQFNAKKFFDFAKKNKKKYSIIENGEDLLVSTWRSDSLINDYRLSI